MIFAYCQVRCITDCASFHVRGITGFLTFLSAFVSLAKARWTNSLLELEIHERRPQCTGCLTVLNIEWMWMLISLKYQGWSRTKKKQTLAFACTWGGFLDMMIQRVISARPLWPMLRFYRRPPSVELIQNYTDRILINLSLRIFVCVFS